MNFSNIKKTALFSLMIAISTDQSFGFGVDSIKSFANNLVYNANPLNWIRQAQPIIQEKKISHELKEIFQLHNNENERRQKDIEMLMAQRKIIDEEKETTSKNFNDKMKELKKNFNDQIKNLEEKGGSFLKDIDYLNAQAKERLPQQDEKISSIFGDKKNINEDLAMGPLSQEQLRKIQSLMDLMQFGKDMEINIGLNKAQLEEITHFQILKYENTEWVKRSVNGENLDKLNYEYVDTTESSYSSPPLAYPPLH